MLRRYISTLILQYTKRYFKNVEANLQLSLWGGDVVLQNLELVDLSFLNKPIPTSLQLKTGTVSELRIRIPWTALATKPVQVVLSNVNLILEAGREGERSPSMSTTREIGDRDGSNGIEGVQEEVVEQEDWSEGIVSRILANLQVEVRNANIAFRDLDEMIEISTSVESFQLYAVNSGWGPEFVNLEGFFRCLRRTCEISGVSVSISRIFGDETSLSEQDYLFRDFSCSIRALTYWTLRLSKTNARSCALQLVASSSFGSSVEQEDMSSDESSVSSTSFSFSSLDSDSISIPPCGPQGVFSIRALSPLHVTITGFHVSALRILASKSSTYLRSDGEAFQPILSLNAVENEDLHTEANEKTPITGSTSKVNSNSSGWVSWAWNQLINEDSDDEEREGRQVINEIAKRISDSSPILRYDVDLNIPSISLLFSKYNISHAPSSSASNYFASLSLNSFDLEFSLENVTPFHHQLSVCFNECDILNLSDPRHSILVLSCRNCSQRCSAAGFASFFSDESDQTAIHTVHTVPTSPSPLVSSCLFENSDTYRISIHERFFSAIFRSSSSPHLHVDCSYVSAMFSMPSSSRSQLFQNVNSFVASCSISPISQPLPSSSNLLTSPKSHILYSFSLRRLVFGVFIPDIMTPSIDASIQHNTMLLDIENLSLQRNQNSFSFSLSVITLSLASCSLCQPSPMRRSFDKSSRKNNTSGWSLSKSSLSPHFQLNSAALSLLFAPISTELACVHNFDTTGTFCFRTLSLTVSNEHAQVDLLVCNSLCRTLDLQRPSCLCVLDNMSSFPFSVSNDFLCLVFSSFSISLQHGEKVLEYAVEKSNINNSCSLDWSCSCSLRSFSCSLIRQKEERVLIKPLNFKKSIQKHSLSDSNVPVDVNVNVDSNEDLQDFFNILVSSQPYNHLETENFDYQYDIASMSIIASLSSFFVIFDTAWLDLLIFFTVALDSRMTASERQPSKIITPEFNSSTASSPLDYFTRSFFCRPINFVWSMSLTSAPIVLFFPLHDAFHIQRRLPLSRYLSLCSLVLCLPAISIDFCTKEGYNGTILAKSPLLISSHESSIYVPAEYEAPFTNFLHFLSSSPCVCCTDIVSPFRFTITWQQSASIKDISEINIGLDSLLLSLTRQHTDVLSLLFDTISFEFSAENQVEEHKHKKEHHNCSRTLWTSVETGVNSHRVSVTVVFDEIVCSLYPEARISEQMISSDIFKFELLSLVLNTGCGFSFSCVDTFFPILVLPVIFSVKFNSISLSFLSHVSPQVSSSILSLAFSSLYYYVDLILPQQSSDSMVFCRINVGCLSVNYHTLRLSRLLSLIFSFFSWESGDQPQTNLSSLVRDGKLISIITPSSSSSLFLSSPFISNHVACLWICFQTDSISFSIPIVFNDEIDDSSSLTSLNLTLKSCFFHSVLPSASCSFSRNVVSKALHNLFPHSLSCSSCVRSIQKACPLPPSFSYTSDICVESIAEGSLTEFFFFLTSSCDNSNFEIIPISNNFNINTRLKICLPSNVDCTSLDIDASDENVPTLTMGIEFCDIDFSVDVESLTSICAAGITLSNFSSIFPTKSGTSSLTSESDLSSPQFSLFFSSSIHASIRQVKITFKDLSSLSSNFPSSSLYFAYKSEILCSDVRFFKRINEKKRCKEDSYSEENDSESCNLCCNMFSIGDISLIFGKYSSQQQNSDSFSSLLKFDHRFLSPTCADARFPSHPLSSLTPISPFITRSSDVKNVVSAPAFSFLYEEPRNFQKQSEIDEIDSINVVHQVCKCDCVINSFNFELPLELFRFLTRVAGGTLKALSSIPVASATNNTDSETFSTFRKRYDPLAAIDRFVQRSTFNIFLSESRLIISSLSTSWALSCWFARVAVHRTPTLVEECWKHACLTTNTDIIVDGFGVAFEEASTYQQRDKKWPEPASFPGIASCVLLRPITSCHINYHVTAKLCPPSMDLYSSPSPSLSISCDDQSSINVQLLLDRFEETIFHLKELQLVCTDLVGLFLLRSPQKEPLENENIDSCTQSVEEEKAQFFQDDFRSLRICNDPKISRPSPFLIIFSPSSESGMKEEEKKANIWMSWRYPTPRHITHITFASPTTSVYPFRAVLLAWDPLSCRYVEVASFLLASFSSSQGLVPEEIHTLKREIAAEEWKIEWQFDLLEVSSHSSQLPSAFELGQFVRVDSARKECFFPSFSTCMQLHSVSLTILHYCTNTCLASVSSYSSNDALAPIFVPLAQLSTSDIRANVFYWHHIGGIASTLELLHTSLNFFDVQQLKYSPFVLPFSISFDYRSIAKFIGYSRSHLPVVFSHIGTKSNSSGGDSGSSKLVASIISPIRVLAAPLYLLHLKHLLISFQSLHSARDPSFVSSRYNLLSYSTSPHCMSRHLLTNRCSIPLYYYQQNIRKGESSEVNLQHLPANDTHSLIVSDHSLSSNSSIVVLSTSMVSAPLSVHAVTEVGSKADENNELIPITLDKVESFWVFCDYNSPHNNRDVTNNKKIALFKQSRFENLVISTVISAPYCIKNRLDIPHTSVLEVCFAFDYQCCCNFFQTSTVSTAGTHMVLEQSKSLYLPLWWEDEEHNCNNDANSCDKCKEKFNCWTFRVHCRSEKDDDEYWSEIIPLPAAHINYTSIHSSSRILRLSLNSTILYCWCNFSATIQPPSNSNSSKKLGPVFGPVCIEFAPLVVIENLTADYNIRILLRDETSNVVSAPPSREYILLHGISFAPSDSFPSCSFDANGETSLFYILEEKKPEEQENKFDDDSVENTTPIEYVGVGRIMIPSLSSLLERLMSSSPIVRGFNQHSHLKIISSAQDKQKQKQLVKERPKIITELAPPIYIRAISRQSHSTDDDKIYVPDGDDVTSPFSPSTLVISFIPSVEVRNFCPSVPFLLAQPLSSSSDSSNSLSSLYVDGIHFAYAPNIDSSPHVPHTTTLLWSRKASSLFCICPAVTRMKAPYSNFANWSSSIPLLEEGEHILSFTLCNSGSTQPEEEKQQQLLEIVVLVQDSSDAGVIVISIKPRFYIHNLCSLSLNIAQLPVESAIGSSQEFTHESAISDSSRCILEGFSFKSLLFWSGVIKEANPKNSIHHNFSFFLMVTFSECDNDDEATDWEWEWSTPFSVQHERGHSYISIRSISSLHAKQQLLSCFTFVDKGVSHLVLFRDYQPPYFICNNTSHVLSLSFKSRSSSKAPSSSCILSPSHTCEFAPEDSLIEEERTKTAKRELREKKNDEGVSPWTTSNKERISVDSTPTSSISDCQVSLTIRIPPSNSCDSFLISPGSKLLKLQGSLPVSSQSPRDLTVLLHAQVTLSRGFRIVFSSLPSSDISSALKTTSNLKFDLSPCIHPISPTPFHISLQCVQLELLFIDAPIFSCNLGGSFDPLASTLKPLAVFFIDGLRFDYWCEEELSDLSQFIQTLQHSINFQVKTLRIDNLLPNASSPDVLRIHPSSLQNSHLQQKQSSSFAVDATIVWTVSTSITSGSCFTFSPIKQAPSDVRLFLLSLSPIHLCLEETFVRYVTSQIIPYIVYTHATVEKKFMPRSESRSKLLDLFGDDNSDFFTLISSICSPQLSIVSMACSPISIRLTLHSQGGILHARRIPLYFSSLIINNVLCSTQRLGNEIAAKYFADILLSSPMVLGSFNVFGAITGWFESLFAGFKSLASVPYQAIQEGVGPFNTAWAFGSGFLSLFQHISSGTLESLSGFTSVIASSFQALSFEEQQQTIQQLTAFSRQNSDEENEEHRQEQQITGFASGLKHGIRLFSDRVLYGLTGVVTVPLRGARDGLHDGSGWSLPFIKGVGRGLAGVVAKPLSGMFGLVSSVSEGLAQTVSPLPRRRQTTIPGEQTRGVSPFRWWVDPSYFASPSLSSNFFISMLTMGHEYHAHFEGTSQMVKQDTATFELDSVAILTHKGILFFHINSSSNQAENGGDSEEKGLIGEFSWPEITLSHLPSNAVAFQSSDGRCIRFLLDSFEIRGKLSELLVFCHTCHQVASFS